jgi:hypothetical protein
MTRARIRDGVAVLFIISHFLLIVLIGIFYVLRGFTFEEATTAIAIVTPVFAGHTTLIVRKLLVTEHTTVQARSEGSCLFLPCSFPDLARRNNNRARHFEGL